MQPIRKAGDSSEAELAINLAAALDNLPVGRPRLLAMDDLRDALVAHFQHSGNVGH